MVVMSKNPFILNYSRFSVYIFSRKNKSQVAILARNNPFKMNKVLSFIYDFFELTSLEELLSSSSQSV